MEGTALFGVVLVLGGIALVIFLVLSPIFIYNALLRQNYLSERILEQLKQLNTQIAGQ